MKNKIMILVLMLGVAFSFTNRLVKAEVSNYITYFAIEEEQYGEARLVFTLTLEPTTSSVSLFLPYRSTNTVDKNGVISYIMFTFTDNTFQTFEWEYVFGTSFDWGNQPGCPNCPLLNLDLTDAFSGKQPKTITISITQTFDFVNTPSGFLDQYINEVQVYVDALNNRVYYYSEGEIYLNTIFSTIPLKPTNPTAPEGYEFTYWALRDGTPYLFTDVTADMLNDNVLYLYSVFKPTNTSVVITNPTDNVPDGLNAILGLVGLNSTIGYRIAYVFIALITLGICAWKVPSSMVIALVQIGVLGMAMFLGMVDIWTVAIVLLVTALVIKYKVGDGL